MASIAHKGRPEHLDRAGRIPTIAGAICLVTAIGAAVIVGRTDALADGLGAFPLVEPLGRRAGTLATAILLAYPALYAVSLLAALHPTLARAATWLGRRVRTTLATIWSGTLTTLLALHLAEGNGTAPVLAALAFVTAGAGLLGRSLERSADPTLRPLARALPPMVMSLCAAALAITHALRATTPPGELDGLLASAILVGVLLLLVGAARDLHQQLRRAPRQLFCRDALQRELALL